MLNGENEIDESDYRGPLDNHENFYRLYTNKIYKYNKDGDKNINIGCFQAQRDSEWDRCQDYHS